MGQMTRSSKWTFLSAAFVTAAVVLGPFIILIWQSTRDLNYFEGRDAFIGVANYVRLMKDEVFISSLIVTLQYAFSASIVTVTVGMLGAVAMYRSSLGPKVAALLIAPFLIAPIVVSLVFALIFDGQLGAAPRVLAALGAQQPDNIIGHPTRVFWALVFVDTWQWFGVIAIIFYARMKRIPNRLYELVLTSGGGRWRQVKDVWVPSIAPVTIAVILFKVIWSLGDAERIDALTAGGGPHGAMRVFAIWMEREYFRYADYGYGAAAAVVFYLAAILAAGLFIRLIRQEREMV